MQAGEDAGRTQHPGYGCKSRIQGRRFESVCDPQVVFHAKVAACSDKNIAPSPYRIRHLEAGHVQLVAYKTESCGLQRPTIDDLWNIEQWDVAVVALRSLLIGLQQRQERRATSNVEGLCKLGSVIAASLLPQTPALP